MMIGTRAFFPFYGILLLLLLSHKIQGEDACSSASCHLHQSIDRLSRSAYSLTNLTSHAASFMKSDYNISDYCNPACTSLAATIMADMNLTTSNFANESRSNILEFYRRVVIGYGYQLTHSIVELLRVQKASTAPTYLTKLKKELKLIKPLITRAVNLDRQLKGLPTLGTTAAIPSNRNSRPQSQSLSSVACHLKECVLSDLEIWSNEMFIDFKKLKDSS